MNTCSARLLQTVEELAVAGDEESAIRLCHTSVGAAEQLSEVCSAFGWDVCESAGVANYGNDTGCRSDAPTLREGFEVCSAAAWYILFRSRGRKRDSSLLLGRAEGKRNRYLSP